MSCYEERDIMELDQQGGHYARHVEAMTAECLHSKSDIAAELAYRDSLIAEAYRRFKQYEMDVDTTAPQDHREFMRKIEGLGV